jgi:hypothetical protein
MRLNGKGSAPGQTDFMDTLGGVVADERKAALVRVRGALAGLLDAVVGVPCDRMEWAQVKALREAVALASEALDSTLEVV